MKFDQKPFTQQRTQEEREGDKRFILKVSMNNEEELMLKKDMEDLQQVKDSTAMKQLWKIGRNVLHGTPEGTTVKAILANLRRNSRIGILDANTEMTANVATKK